MMYKYIADTLNSSSKWSSKNSCLVKETETNGLYTKWLNIKNNE